MYKPQIESILKLDSQSRDNFKGVFAIDELPKLSPSGSYVINYDPHDKPGSHWVAVFSFKNSVEFFDSTGNPPLDSRLCKFVGPSFTYSPYKLQQVLGNACGFYSTYYILQRSRNISSNDILKILTRVNSDYVVKSYLYRYYKPFFV